MIEILCVIALCKHLGSLLRAKGRRPGGFQALAVVLWFGGELTAAVIGVTLGITGAGLYVTTLLGALVGASIAWAVASLARPARTIAEDLGPVFE